MSGGDPLVERCQRGEEAAFAELFELHKQDVARVIYRFVGSGVELEDLVQDVFLQVYRSIGRFQGTSRFSTWLYRVTVNVALMHKRSQRSRPRLVEEERGPVPEHDQTPEDEAARNLRIAAFHRVLDKLSEKKRTVFVLHELEGVSPKEIGEIVGAPILTVRTRLFYARRELNHLLKDEPTLAAAFAELEVEAHSGAQTLRKRTT